MEAEFQRRVSWAELCLHADQREADGAVRERELGVAVQIFEGKLVFGALLVNLSRLVLMVVVLEGIVGFLEGIKVCKERFTWQSAEETAGREY